MTRSSRDASWAKRSGTVLLLALSTAPALRPAATRAQAAPDVAEGTPRPAATLLPSVGPATVPMVSSAVAPPRAEAGPDLTGEVGRPVTLHGQVAPGGLAGFRWVQTAGPPARLRLDDGPRLVFLPEHEGLYRFALIVARHSRVSEPDDVAIHVQSSPETATTRTHQAELNQTGPLDLQVRNALLIIPDGARVAPTLAAAFAQAADRMDLYASYDEVFSELSRRIGPALPADPVRQGDWNALLFQPLSARLVAGLREVDLDLAAPEGRHQPLNQAQRDRLASLFQAFAAGARGVAAIARR